MLIGRGILLWGPSGSATMSVLLSDQQKFSAYIAEDRNGDRLGTAAVKGASNGKEPA